MTRTLTILLATGCLWLTGCGSVVSRSPVGLTPAANLERIEGAWSNGEGQLIIRQMGGKGRLQIGVLEFDEKRQQFKFKQRTAVARQAGSRLWLNVVLEPDDQLRGKDPAKSAAAEDGPGGTRHETTQYYPLVVDIAGDRLQLRLLDHDAVAKALKQGRLQGFKPDEGSDIVLTSSPQQLHRYFSSAEADACFHGEPAATFHRIE